MLPLIVLPILDITDGAVMNVCADDPANQYGRIKIPSAEIDVPLAYVSDDCGCYLGLWNGGRINGDAQMFEAVKVGDWAMIYQPEGNLVVECVQISYAVEGCIRADGDVLVCVKTPFPLIIRVYRLIVL